MSADQVLEIPDFDARVEKERANMAARKVETAKGHGGARDGAGRKAKEMKELVESVEAAQAHGRNQVAIGNLKNSKTKGSNKTETIIARLKRDAATDPKAEALLQQVAGNNISARQAASLILDAPCI